MSHPRCRRCSTELRHTFVDLGMSPPCENYLTAAQLDAAERFYPRHVRGCEKCLVVQDPAYHEHFSYLLAAAGTRGSRPHGVNIEELPTHGGSMRLWSVPPDRAAELQYPVARVLPAEAAAGLNTLEGQGFAQQVASSRRNDFIEFLVHCQRDGERVVGYGAPGMGNTLLNQRGVRSDLMKFSVDRKPAQAENVPARHPHFDLSGRAASRPAGRLRGDHAVEPARRDYRPAGLRTWLGRPVRRQLAPTRSLLTNPCERSGP